jgi:hypothetical protein
VVSSSLTSGVNGTRTIILRLRRPALFQFQPGHYAQLRLRKISTGWHSFYIASNNENFCELDFYIRVPAAATDDGKSWALNVWRLLEDQRDSPIALQLDVDVRGPLGTPFPRMSNYSHVLTVVSGSGIFPVLSQLKQRAHQLLRMCHKARASDMERQLRSVRVRILELPSRKKSIAECVIRSCGNRKSGYLKLEETLGDPVKRSYLSASHPSHATREDLMTFAMPTHRRINQTKHQICLTVLLVFLAILGFSLLEMLVSWSALGNHDGTDGAVREILYATLVFHACFAVFALCVWEVDGRELPACYDVVATYVALLMDWFILLQHFRSGSLHRCLLIPFCILTGYMSMRTWLMATMHRTKSEVGDTFTNSQQPESFEVIWMTDSASLVSDVLADLEVVWKRLIDTGNETLACNISVYLTDKDGEARAILESEISASLLGRKKSIHFCRPKFSAILECHITKMIATRQQSQTLINCRGIQSLIQEVSRCKIWNDLASGLVDGWTCNHPQVFTASETHADE